MQQPRRPARSLLIVCLVERYDQGDILRRDKTTEQPLFSFFIGPGISSSVISRARQLLIQTYCPKEYHLGILCPSLVTSKSKVS